MVKITENGRGAVLGRNTQNKHLRPLIDSDPAEAPAAMAFARPEDGPDEPAQRITGQPATITLDRPLSMPDEPEFAPVQRANRAPPIEFPEMTQGSIEKGWVRVGLPSRCVPYDFTEVHVRTFGVEELAGLASSRANASFTEMLDVLDQCVNVDIRDLTGPDQRYLMYWWRINSYTKSPYTLQWPSRYGNSNLLTINNGVTPGMNGQYVVLDTQIINLAMTKDEYAEYQAKGICFPTVRDAEMLGADMNPKMRFLMQNAQYAYVDPDTKDLAEAKAQALRDGGIEMFEDIQDFATRIEHGVKEVVHFKDQYYKADEALEYLKRQALALRIISAASQQNDGSDPDMPKADQATIKHQLDLADDFEEEAEEIEALLKAGKRPQPREEAITLSINVMSFFS